MMVTAALVSAGSAHQDGGANGQRPEAGLGSPELYRSFYFYVHQQLCSHTFLLFIPYTSSTAENMGQSYVLVH